ncbi:MAG: nitroreductase [Burkholderiaceae bacterium]|nr:nitroreductase [Burkholderiaceae bacterium]
MTDTPLHTLNTRRSVKFLRAPAPRDAELAQILQASMSAPDHGALMPWRYAIIRGPAIAKLADVAMNALKAAGDPRLTPEKEKSVRAWLADVPLLIAIAQHIDHANQKSPQQERLLAVGASVMNILNAAHMLGYGAFWSTGVGTYVEAVQDALGFDALDYAFLGFVALGTPGCAVPMVERPHFSAVTREWTGE